MKSKIFLIIIFISTLLVSCGDDEEFRFVGKVIGGRLCSPSLVGYIIEIQSPDDIGGTITIGNTTYNNTVMAYRASRILHNGEIVYGVAHKTSSFAALNCQGLIEEDLPEIILLSVDEEPFQP